MHIIRAAQAPHFEVPGVEFTALAAPSRGSAGLCTWLLTVAPGLKSPEPHTLDSDEVFMVVSGTVQLGLDTEALGPGDAAVAPAGAPIQLCNPGDQPATVYVAIRAGFVAQAADGSLIGTPPWAL
ncbi:cupin domain-containing protein [Krasilnikovia sp. M28-CT-15]|uniref:cupin domain-containing protein n=1 Tax=Krasilnikovia sp. M28-CT-15 TaxID=3373540 RepID=UPI00387728D2